MPTQRILKTKNKILKIIPPLHTYNRKNIQKKIPKNFRKKLEEIFQ